MTASLFVRREKKRLQVAWSDGNLPFPASGSPSARIWQAILTNRGRIHERLQKNDGCKTAFVIFGTPFDNKSELSITSKEMRIVPSL